MKNNNQSKSVSDPFNTASIEPQSTMTATNDASFQSIKSFKETYEKHATPINYQRAQEMAQHFHDTNPDFAYLAAQLPAQIDSNGLLNDYGTELLMEHYDKLKPVIAYTLELMNETGSSSPSAISVNPEIIYIDEQLGALDGSALISTIEHAAKSPEFLARAKEDKNNGAFDTPVASTTWGTVNKDIDAERTQGSTNPHLTYTNPDGSNIIAPQTSHARMTENVTALREQTGLDWRYQDGGDAEIAYIHVPDSEKAGAIAALKSIGLDDIYAGESNIAPFGGGVDFVGLNVANLDETEIISLSQKLNSISTEHPANAPAENDASHAHTAPQPQTASPLIRP